MIIKGTNGSEFTFNLKVIKLSKICEQTGYVYTKRPKIYSLPTNLGIDDLLSSHNILISDVKQIIRWFKNLSSDKIIKSHLIVDNKQLKFELLGEYSNYKRIKITHDTTIPVPGTGGYSLAPGLQYKDVFKKLFIESEINQKELHRIIKELTNEFKNANRIIWK